MPSNKIKEFLLTVLLAVVFTLLTTLPVAVLSLLCTAAVAVSIGYTVVKYHYGYVAFTCILVFVVYLLFQQNPVSALAAALPLVLCGLTLGISYNLKFSAFKLLCIFTAVYVLNITVNIKLAGMAQAGQNVFEEAVSSVGQVYRESLTAVYGSQLSSAEINNIVSELTSTLLRFSPSFIVIACICFALLSYYMFKRILTIRKESVACFQSFCEWRADKFISITYFVILVLYFLVPANGFFSDTLLNMVTVMTFIFFILGLSFLEFLLKKKFPKSFTRKMILIAVCVASFILMGLPFLALSVCGAMDGCFDYRRRKLKR